MNLDTEGSASNDNLGRSKLSFEANRAFLLYFSLIFVGINQKY